MPVYYMLHDAERFQGQIQPAFAASWRQRSFEPCRALCQSLADAAKDFSERYHLGAGELLLSQAACGLHFSPASWRALVGEVLLYGAAEVPEIQIAPDTLCCLLAPDKYLANWVPREQFAPIQQAHHGSRDLVFGTGYYRPEHAGYNDSDDVTRLARYLQAVNPDQWTLISLALLRDVQDDEERADELEFAREWFPVLSELYQRAEERKQIVVCEVL